MSPSDDLPATDAPSSRGHDWPAQAADSIVDVVGTVRQKTTGPALTATRGVVYGLLIVIVAIMAVVLLIVGLVRLAHNWVDVWLAYVVLGAVFAIVGGLMWRQRAPAIDALDGEQPPAS
jgi:hypothetical protein